jgi:hypothetical protein
MIMKKLVVFSIFIIFGVQGAFSQYDLQALQLSRSLYQSDARSVAVGNAIGAVGANYFSSVINPAGLAFFRTGEFVISTAFNGIKTNTEYLGNTNATIRNQLSIPSIGFVFPTINKIDGKQVTEGWVSTSFAFGINRTNSFLGRSYYDGINSNSSILDYYVESANGLSPDNFPTVTNMAYQSYLINPIGNDMYETAMGDSLSAYKLEQSKSYSSYGSAHDMNLAYAANYSNLVYLGFKIGIPFADYIEEYTFTEENQLESNYLMSSYESQVDVSSVGFNAGIGIIVKPSKYFRIGASVMSPTFFRVKERYSEEMNADLDTMSVDPFEVNGRFNYNLTTPFKATASAAFILGKSGFISVDYEYIDYSSAVMSSNEVDENIDKFLIYENKNISQYFTSASNLRVGAEYKLGIFAFRAGYGFYQTPYDAEYKPEGGDRSYSIYSLGVGLREKAYYVDLAWQRYLNNEFEVPYFLSDVDVEGASKDNKGTNLIMTLGFRF